MGRTATTVLLLMFAGLGACSGDGEQKTKDVTESINAQRPTSSGALWVEAVQSLTGVVDDATRTTLQADAKTRAGARSDEDALIERKQYLLAAGLITHLLGELLEFGPGGGGLGLLHLTGGAEDVLADGAGFVLLVGALFTVL